MVSGPSPGVHYPGSYAELMAWFRNDEDALDYLEWLRWGEVFFVCGTCGADRGWRLGPGLWPCEDCKQRVSVTAGTISTGLGRPLTV